MVLRKPYKFFIKYFRLFHLILATMVVYSLIRISHVITFINKFTNSDVTLKTITMDEFNSLYNIVDIIIPILTIILSVILLVVMTIKKKPNKFYAYSTLTSIALLAMTLHGRSTMLELTNTWLSRGSLESIVDLYVFVIIACAALVAIALARAIGFNIGRFDFNSDLLQFELSEEDNAEFEVALNFDVIEMKRNMQKRHRYIKYFLKENKSTIIWSIAITIAFVGLYGLYSFSKNRIKAQPITNLSMIGDVGFTVNEAYIIDKSPNGKELPDDLNLVVLDVTLKNSTKRALKLNPGLLSLTIGEDIYGRKLTYGSYVSDLGTVFYNEDIKRQSEEKKLFVFAVPEKNINNKIYLGVSNYGNLTYYKLNPVKIETKDKVISAKLNDEMKFDGSTIGNSKIKITGFDIKYQFEVPYKFKNLNSVETLAPVFSGNTDKALLKIVTNYSFDKISTTKTLQGLITRYGYIEYVIGDKTYKINGDIKEIKSVKAKVPNTYYFEVDSNVMKADKVILGFRLRNADYKYYLKGSA